MSTAPNLVMPPLATLGVRRFVFLGKCCDVRIEAAASISASPFYSQQLLLLLSNTATAEDFVHELDLTRRVVQVIDDTRSVTSAQPSLTSVLSVASTEPRCAGTGPLRCSQYLPDVAADVFVYIATNTLDRATDHVDVLSRMLPQSARPGTCIVLCPNECYAAIKTSLQRIKALESWTILTIRVPFLGPAAHETASTVYPRFHEELVGPLENVCLGVALGVVKQLPVNAGQVAGVVPLDIAINVALVVLTLQRSHQLPHALRDLRHMEIGIADNSRDSLVWGMIGEYMIDYYGRFHSAIQQAVPMELFTDEPTVDFQAHFNDMWNWGISLTTPMIWMRSYYASTFQKNHLRRFPHSATAERMQRVLSSIDTAIDKLNAPLKGSSSAALQDMMQSAQRRILLKNSTNNGCNPEDQEGAHASAPPSFEVNNAAYLTILRILERGGKVGQQCLPYVSLQWVQWEMYVKRICVSVLQFVAKFVLDIRKSSTADFPSPTRAFHNDLIFTGPDRAPPTNLWLRRLFPDLHWALRCGQQPNGHNIRLQAGGTQQRRLAILAQPHIQLLMNQLAREQNVSKDAIEKRADAILLGIGDTMNHKQLRTLGLGIRLVFQTLYERININPDAYDKLFAAFRQPRCAVVIIPAHRSYVDFLVVSYLLVMMGFPVPHICSGEDFLRLGRISEVLRGSGAFFMRRSFRSDRLYGALFKEYIRHLVRDCQCVEFFMEGMRSRTGKTMPPKLGILKFVTDAFFEKQDEIDDVLFVPVGLSYEKLLEGNVYANELMGIPKPKETVGNLLKSASILKSKYGALNVVVGDPISLKSFADDPHQCPPGFDRAPEGQRVSIKSSASSVSAGGGTYTPLRVLASVAWRVTYDIQKNIIVTPTALVAAVILCMLDSSALKQGISAAVISSNVEWLRSAVLHRNGKMNTQFAVCDGAQLMHYALNLLSPHVWMSPLSHVFLLQDSAAGQPEATQMLLWIYSNQLLHVFADEAVLAVCARAFARSSTTGSCTTPAGDVVTEPEDCISIGDLKGKAKMLRIMLSAEIPNYQRPCPISIDSWFANALGNLFDDSRSVRRLPLGDSDEEEVIVARNTFTSFVTQLVYPLIESHWIVLMTIRGLVSAGKTLIDEGAMMKAVHQVGLQLCRQKFSPFVHSCNRESLKNSLGFLIDAKVIATVSAASATSYKLVKAARTPNDPPLAPALSAENLAAMNSAQSTTPSSESDAARMPTTLDAMTSLVNCLRCRPTDVSAAKEVDDAVLKVLAGVVVTDSTKSKM